MKQTFELREGFSPDGSPWFAVVQYVDGEPMGADHHWLRRQTAEYAKDAYEHGESFPVPPFFVDAQ